MEPASAIIRTAQSWAHDNLVPLNASIETTLACNIRCVHCYNFDRDQPRRRAPEGPASEAGCGPESPELSTEEILSLMGDLRAAPRRAFPFRRGRPGTLEAQKPR